MCSYYIELPCDLLIENDGLFSTTQTREIVQRHTAAGHYPVVRYYGVDPTLSLIPIVSGVELFWSQHESETKYNTYYGTLETGPWTQSNAELIANNSSGNSGVITGLTGGKSYWTWVQSVTADSDDCGESEKVRFIVPE